MILIARIITNELDDTINYMRVRYVLRFYEQIYICLFVLSRSVSIKANMLIKIIALTDYYCNWHTVHKICSFEFYCLMSHQQLRSYWEGAVQLKVSSDRLEKPAI